VRRVGNSPETMRAYRLKRLYRGSARTEAPPIDPPIERDRFEVFALTWLLAFAGGITIGGLIFLAVMR